jgi:fructose-specific component phosphotransferase system IIB-like protein
MVMLVAGQSNGKTYGSKFQNTNQHMKTSFINLVEESGNIKPEYTLSPNLFHASPYSAARKKMKMVLRYA